MEDKEIADTAEETAKETAETVEETAEETAVGVEETTETVENCCPSSIIIWDTHSSSVSSGDKNYTHPKQTRGLGLPVT